MADLFENGSSAVDIIKWKDIYHIIETATDACEDGECVQGDRVERACVDFLDNDCDEDLDCDDADLCTIDGCRTGETCDTTTGSCVHDGPQPVGGACTSALDCMMAGGGTFMTCDEASATCANPCGS